MFPRTSLVTSWSDFEGLIGDSPSIRSSTYGNLGRYLSLAFCLRSRFILLLLSISSSRRGRTAGGRSTETEILRSPAVSLSFRVPANHWSRCDRSEKRTITPAFGLLLSLWQADILVPNASSSERPRYLWAKSIVLRLIQQ